MERREGFAYINNKVAAACILLTSKEIDPSECEVIKELGCGNFGYVSKVRLRSGHQIAMKVPAAA